MQITNHLTYRTPNTETAPEMKPGEIYSAQIKERLSETEAVLKIRGKEITAKFEDKMPSGDRATVQITGQKDQITTVKTISADETRTAASKIANETRLYESLRLSNKDLPELKQAVRMLLKKDAPVSKEIVQELRAFFEKAEGSAEAKNNTVKALINKGLEITCPHLRAVHEALNGEPLTKVLTSIANELDPEFSALKAQESVSAKLSEVQAEAVKGKSEIVHKGTEIHKIFTTQHTSNIDRTLSNLVTSIRKMVEKEPDLQKAVQKVREEIVNNPKMDPNLAKQIEKAAGEAEKLQTIGKDRLIQALKQAEVQLSIRNRFDRQTVVAKSGQPTVGQTEPSSKNVEELIGALKKEVQTNPNLQRTIEKVQNEILNTNRLPQELASKLGEAVNEAKNLLIQGRITTGKETLSNALSDVERKMQALKAEVDIGKVGEFRINEGRPSEVIRAVRESVQQESNLQKAVEKVQTEVVNNPKIDREVAQKVEKAIREAVQLQQLGREGAGRERLVQALAKAEVELSQIESRSGKAETVQTDTQKATTVTESTSSRASEVIRVARESVQQEPNLQRAVEKVQAEVVNNPKIDREVAQKVEKAVREAVQLQQLGREEAGRERLVQALAKAEVELSQIESRSGKAETVQSDTQKSTTATENASSRASEVIRAARETVQQEPNLQRAAEKVQAEVVNNPKIDREVAQKVEKAVREAVQLQQLGREGAGRERLVQALAKAEVGLSQIESRSGKAETVQTETQKATTATENPSSRVSEVVRAARESVQQEPNLQKAVEKVYAEVVNNPKIDREVAQKVEKAVRDALQLQQIGRETTGRNRLVQALAKAEIEVSQIENRTGKAETVQSDTQKSTTVTENASSRASEVIRAVRESVQQEPNLQRAVEKAQAEVVNNPRIDREVAQKVEKAVRDALQLQQMGREITGRNRLVEALSKAEIELSQIENLSGKTETVQIDSRRPINEILNQHQVTELQPSEIIKSVKEAIQQEPDLQKAINQVRDQIVHNPKINREIAQAVQKALIEANQFQYTGRDSQARERLSQALTRAETELTQTESAGQSKANQLSLKDSIQQVRQQLQLETDLKQGLQKVQEQVTHIKNSDPEIAKSIEKALSQANQLDNAGRERLIKMLQQAEQVLKRTETAQAQTKDTENNQTQNTNVQNLVNQTEKQNLLNQEQQINNTADQKEQTADLILKTESKPSETIKQALKEFQAEANLEDALNFVRKEISSNPNINLNHLEKMEKAIERATQLGDRGREIAARQHITKELTELYQSLAKTEPQSATKGQATPDPATQYDVNEMLQSLQLQSKDILVTKVTQKLAEATYEFREIKREISRNLDSVQRLMDTFKRNAYPQAKQMLETAISKLDNAILKSDMMLFTDMKTEKQLLQASTKLAEAKKLLAKGDYSQASKIVGQVKQLIDKINFKPSEQKIMHFVSKESLSLENTNTSKHTLAALETAARGYSVHEPSARQMFDLVRSLGLNHDSELANNLVFKYGDQAQQEQQQDNMKAVLLKLQNEEAGTKVAQQVEQALNNLTGQQLLSKSDSSGTMQSMLFNIPLFLGERAENLQIYVNSKNQGQQVDWENCNLYFLIETKRLGDVGIMLSATNRNLSITIKNDKPGFKEKMEPLANITKERLQEIGYQIENIHFARMTPVETKKDNHQVLTEKKHEQRPIFTEKGMDFRI